MPLGLSQNTSSALQMRSGLLQSKHLAPPLATQGVLTLKRMAFFGAATFATLVAIGVSSLLIRYAGLMTTLAVVIEVLVSFFVNFFVRKFFIFKS